jgi:hypothetical protein
MDVYIKKQIRNVRTMILIMKHMKNGIINGGLKYIVGYLKIKSKLTRNDNFV